MTNAEKYLKDEKYIFDIAKGIAEAICYDDMEHLKKITEKEIKHWFTNNIKAQLTEDERVILRNIDKKYTHIGRGDGTPSIELYIKSKDGFKHCWCFYNHIFQFIKERRRILY